MSSSDVPSPRLRVALIVVTSLTGAALVLLVPRMLDPSHDVPVALPVTLGLVLLGCAVGAGWLRVRQRP